MICPLTLAILLVTQAPEANPINKANAKAAEAKRKVDADSFPAETAKRPAKPATSREATLRSTLEKRRLAEAKKKKARADKAAWEREQAAEWQLYVERVGPIIAAQERDAWQRQMEQRHMAAQEVIAGALAQRAITDRQRLQLEQQEAGLPQIFVPGQGFVTYPGAYAMPR